MLESNRKCKIEKFNQLVRVCPVKVTVWGNVQVNKEKSVVNLCVYIL